MLNNSILLCCDEQKQQARVITRLAQTCDTILSCRLAQLERLIQQEPEAVLVIVWKQFTAELRLITELAEKHQSPLLIILSEFNENDINRLPESSGYIMMPLDSEFDLFPWIQYARKSRMEQIKSGQEVARLSEKLEERKYVEKAKGLLMKLHKLDEDSAYKALRSSAMQNSQPLGQVAKNLITTLEMVG